MECAIPNFVIHEYNVNTMMPNMLALGVYDYQPVDGKYTVPDLPDIGNEISDTAYRNSTICYNRIASQARIFLYPCFLFYLWTSPHINRTKECER